MTKRLPIIAFLLCLLFFIGCTDFSAERKQVADLMDQLDKAKKVFNDTHPDSLGAKDSDIEDRLLIITEHYTRNKDTMDFELGLLLADFKGYRKAFRGLATKREQIRTEMDLTFAQLANLDKDLKTGGLEKDVALKYLADERSATKALCANIYQLDTLLQRGVNGYHKYAPQIDSVMNSLGAPD